MVANGIKLASIVCCIGLRTLAIAPKGVDPTDTRCNAWPPIALRTPPRASARDSRFGSPQQLKAVPGGQVKLLIRIGLDWSLQEHVQKLVST